jgi:hypothetical protein
MAMDPAATEAAEATDPKEAIEFAVRICESFDLFCLTHDYTGVKIDPLWTWCAVVSWLKDLKRHGAFHGSKELNAFKRSGFLLHWLVKIKPISPVSADPPATQINSRYLAINEEFALFLAMFQLNTKLSSIGDKGLVSRFVYALYYRDDNAKSLASKLELLYNAVPRHLRGKA